MIKIKIISLGWGVQSWTMAAMVALGELPPVDFAIHSDTQWEHAHTYQFARQWTPWLEQHGLKVVTVTDDQQPKKVATANTDIPAFTYSEADGVSGQLRRQCTSRWKITPMRRYISKHLTEAGIKKQAGVVQQWLGITTDEWRRVKSSDVLYINNHYPLLYDKKMSRSDCVLWLMDRGLPAPKKSACVFCPYKSNAAWSEMKRQNGKDWKTALAIDQEIRGSRPPYLLYLHSVRIPLEQAVSIPEDHGFKQLPLPCDSGHCFL